MKRFVVILALMLVGFSAQATDIRVRNDSDVALYHVIVGGKNYGDIPPRATTDYQQWDLAYHAASVVLVANSNSIMFQPKNYLREGELGRGKYTYVLSFESGVLRIRAEKDE